MLADNWQQVHRILAVRMDNIGDVIMLGPALREVARALPGVEITLLASPGGSQVAPLLPWVHDVITWRALWQDVSGGLPFDPQRELDLVQDLRQRQFDAALIFTSFSQSPHPPAYACYLAGIPIRAGHSKEFGGKVLSHAFAPPPDSGHQVERNLALVENAGFPVLDRNIELAVPADAQAKAEALLAGAGVDPDAPFAVLAAGASCAARRYPPERFAAVARLLAAQAGLPVVLVGAEREREVLAPVIETANRPGIVSLVGQTGVAELAGIVQRSSLVLANNSASLHLADAFGTPMVILYSGTEYETQWMPRRSPARLLRVPTDCSPCYRFTCPFELECLDISPAAVVAAAMELVVSVQQQEQAVSQGCFEEGLALPGQPQGKETDLVIQN